MRNVLIVFVGLLIGGSVWLHMLDYKPLVERMIAGVVEKSRYMTDVDENQAEILFCGTGSPSRSPDRAGPCLALIVNGEMFLFDAGEGAIGKLHEYAAPVLKLRAVFLTHLHSDHMSGLAEVLHNTWLYGRVQPVEVVGPPGTMSLMSGISTAYEADINERLHVLSVDGVDPALAFPPGRDVRVDGKDIVTVYENGDLKIEAFQVKHPQWEYAYGYRLNVAGRTIVISGDTTVSDGIRRYAKGADLLIHEAMNASFMDIAGQAIERTNVPMSSARFERIADVHTSTLDLAELAESTGVSSLMLTHLIPPIPNNFISRSAFAAGMSDRFQGEITVAHDGMRIDLETDIPR